MVNSLNFKPNAFAIELTHESIKKIAMGLKPIAMKSV